MSANGPEHLSPSQIKRLQDCPRSWAYRYLEKLPDPEREDAGVGRLVHEVLDQAGKENRGMVHLDQFAELCRQRIENYPPSVYDGAVTLLMDLEFVDFQRCEDTEHTVEEEVEGVPIKAVVDRVDVDPDDGSVIIWDYKTGRGFVRRDEHERDPQVLVYLVLARILYPTVPITARWWWLGNDQVVDVHWSPARDAEGRTLIRAWFEARQRLLGRESIEHWPARVGRRCGFCGARDVCAAFQGAMMTPAGEIPKVLNGDAGELDRLVGMRRDLSRIKSTVEGQLKQVDKLLRPLLESGPLQADGYRMRLTQSSRACAPDPAKAVAYLAERSGLKEATVKRQILGAVDKEAVAEFIAAKFSEGERREVADELELRADGRRHFPKLDAREVKETF